MSCAPASSKTRKRRFRTPAMNLRRRDRARGLQALSLSWCGVAANSAGRFVALDFREQPHGKNHEKSEECHDVLDTVVPKHVLMITSDGGHQNGNQRKAELDFNGHRYFLRTTLRDVCPNRSCDLPKGCQRQQLDADQHDKAFTAI